MHDIQFNICELNALPQFFKIWLDACYAKGCSKKTIDQYKRDVGQFVNWLLEYKPNSTPEDVSPNDIRQ